MLTLIGNSWRRVHVNDLQARFYARRPNKVPLRIERRLQNPRAPNKPRIRKKGVTETSFYEGKKKRWTDFELGQDPYEAQRPVTIDDDDPSDFGVKGSYTSGEFLEDRDFEDKDLHPDFDEELFIEDAFPKKEQVKEESEPEMIETNTFQGQLDTPGLNILIRDVPRVEDFEKTLNSEGPLLRIWKTYTRKTVPSYPEESEELIWDKDKMMELEMEDESSIINTIPNNGFQFSSGTTSGIFKGLVETFDHILAQKQYQLLIKSRSRRRFQIWWAKSWKQRQANQARARVSYALRKEKKRQLEEANKNDPNMVYYKSIGLWVSRESLKNSYVRNAFGAIMNNASISMPKKRILLEQIVNEIERVVVRGDVPEKVKNTVSILTDLPPPEVVTDTRETDGLFVLPFKNWNELITKVESSMDPSERAEKYLPPSHNDKVQTRY